MHPFRRLPPEPFTVYITWASPTTQTVDEKPILTGKSTPYFLLNNHHTAPTVKIWIIVVRVQNCVTHTKLYDLQNHEETVGAQQNV